MRNTTLPETPVRPSPPIPWLVPFIPRQPLPPASLLLIVSTPYIPFYEPPEITSLSTSPIASRLCPSNDSAHPNRRTRPYNHFLLIAIDLCELSHSLTIFTVSGPSSSIRSSISPIFRILLKITSDSFRFLLQSLITRSFDSSRTPPSFDP